MTGELHVVLGASGGLGGAVVNALNAQGRRVRAVSRGEAASVVDGVESLHADIATADGARAACAGATVVYHAAQPPYDKWPEQFPAMTSGIVEAAGAADAKLVMVDNLYMYGPTRWPLTESLPRGSTGPKGSTRTEMEGRLLDAHRAGDVRVTIGRLSDYYGRNGLHSAVAALVLAPAAKGKAMRWIGRTDVPHTLHYLDDAARGLITLADHDAADGEVWHLPAAPPVTGSEFMALVNAALPSPVKAGSIGALSMRIAGLFSKEAKETVECLYQWTAPFVSDSSKFDSAFGPLRVTPHDVAVAATVAWMLDHAAAS